MSGLWQRSGNTCKNKLRRYFYEYHKMLWGSNLQRVISNLLGNAMKTAIIFQYVEQSTIQKKCKVASFTLKFSLVPQGQTRIFLHPEGYL
jgi:hypothetical protein